ncbi:hypothetical protein [Janthinobacterium lividum]|uniref:hypothetical protein n=1 Tax=Janthinobacterium lividum TaxID=29581 RepID=UPI00140D9238|nr:hypothetical protein [Janthinobacterium lividum]NHQ90451.1 hypothetical protein [Janthinobacterium lividum]
MARQVPWQMPVWRENGGWQVEKRDHFVLDQMNVNQADAVGSHVACVENACLQARPCDNSRLAAAQPMAGARG